MSSKASEGSWSPGPSDSREGMGGAGLEKVGPGRQTASGKMVGEDDQVRTEEKDRKGTLYRAGTGAAPAEGTLAMTIKVTPLP